MLKVPDISKGCSSGLTGSDAESLAASLGQHHRLHMHSSDVADVTEDTGRRDCILSRLLAGEIGVPVRDG